MGAARPFVERVPPALTQRKKCFPQSPQHDMNPKTAIQRAGAPSPDQGCGDHDHGPPRKRLSEFLTDITTDPSLSDITVSELMRLMEGRARAALILIFAFPNVLPAPPGLSALLGLPLLYLTSQMMLGRIPWLPRFIGARGMQRSTFAALVERAVPFLNRAERLLRPRWTWMVSHSAEKLLGALALILAVVVTLPIPLGNMMPAFAICLIALGVLERDGLWAGLGVVVGLAALLLSATVVYGILKAALFVVFGALP